MVYPVVLKDVHGDLKYVEAELNKYALNSPTLLGETSSHLLQAGGKRLRPAFVLLSARLFNYCLERIGSLAVAIELIHMATLVHDDVIDNASLRRGIPTVRLKWGDPMALYTGDYLFAQALLIIARHGNQEIARILADVSLKMCDGEIEQIQSIGKTDQGLRTYLKRIKRKTALLISACCSIGALAGDASRDDVRRLKYFGYYLGMAFQITDDLLDFVGSEKVFGKPVGSDLKQGILTMPVLYALQTPHLGSRLAQILGQEEKAEADWEKAIALVKESGALAKTQNCCHKYLDKAKRELLRLPDLPSRKILLDITEFIGTRDF